MSERSNNGGPAFPNPQIPHPGMRLRDWFAGMALQGWMASWPQGDDNPIPLLTAEWCYELADAMLSERDKAQGYDAPEPPEFPGYTDTQGNEHFEF